MSRNKRKGIAFVFEQDGAFFFDFASDIAAVFNDVIEFLEIGFVVFRIDFDVGVGDDLHGFGMKGFVDLGFVFESDLGRDGSQSEEGRRGHKENAIGILKTGFHSYLASFLALRVCGTKKDTTVRTKTNTINPLMKKNVLLLSWSSMPANKTEAW